MDGWQSAFQSNRLAQFCQGQVWLPAQQLTHLAVMRDKDGWFASGAMMLRGDVADPPPLLQELLDHAQRNLVAPGHFLAGAFFLIVGSQDSFPQIQRERLSLHAPEPIITHQLWL